MLVRKQALYLSYKNPPGVKPILLQALQFLTRQFKIPFNVQYFGSQDDQLYLVMLSLAFLLIWEAIPLYLVALPPPL